MTVGKTTRKPTTDKKKGRGGVLRTHLWEGETNWGKVGVVFKREKKKL